MVDDLSIGVAVKLDTIENAAKLAPG